MGKLREACPVKFFFGVIGAEAHIREAREKIGRKFELEEREDPIWDFDHTDYYEAEMGKGLKRSFFRSRGLGDSSKLPGYKVNTNGIESELSEGGARRVNIDPGYLNEARIVLASTKDYWHRIHLGDGVYGEVTLRFFDNGFRALEHTYPDYNSEEYLEFFNQMRKDFVKELKEGRRT